MEIYILLKKHIDRRISVAISDVKTSWLWPFDENLYPEPDSDNPWQYHFDNAFLHVRQSVAYDSSGTEVLTNTPVYEQVD